MRQLQDSGLIERWDDEYGIVNQLEGQAKHLPSLVGGALTELETITAAAVGRVVTVLGIPYAVPLAVQMAFFAIWAVFGSYQPGAGDPLGDGRRHPARRSRRPARDPATATIQILVREWWRGRPTATAVTQP